MRILMVQHMPWTRNLGAPRVQFELAEDFRELGHEVDKFDIDDAFPTRNRLQSFFEQSQFPARAAAFIRQQRNNYDVVDAHQGNLPFPKSELQFSGVMAARSCGLTHFFEAYQKQEMAARQARGERDSGSLIGNVLRSISKALTPTLAWTETSFAHADVINVLNQDEYIFVTETLGWKDKVVLFNHGFREQRFQEFAEWQVPPAQRLTEQTVIYMGYWSERKGARELPNIVRQVREVLPQTKFMLLGTGYTVETILGHFAAVDRSAMEVYPAYTSEELPRLLARGTVGVFPSYCEGFAWVVLEQLVAGLPIVAYDIPGPREMLRLLPNSMVPVGDAAAMTENLIKLLQGEDYIPQSQAAYQVGQRFRNREIAEKLLHIYEQRLSQLKS